MNRWSFLQPFPIKMELLAAIESIENPASPGAGDINNNDTVVNISDPLDGSFHEDTSGKTCFSCQFCLRRFRNERNLALHENGHPSKQFVCKNATIVILTQTELLEHNNKKHSHLCDKCGSIYKSKQSLKTHKHGVHKVHINSPLKTFTCTYPSCDFFIEKFTSRHTLTLSIRKKNLICVKCARNVLEPSIE